MSALGRLRAVPTDALLRLAGCEQRGRRWVCPACRHDDPRGTVAVAGALWRCHHCGAGGDGPSIAALLATGQLRPAQWGPVYRWAEERGVITRDDGQRSPPRPATLEVRGRLRPLPAVPEVLAGDAELSARWQAAHLAAAAVEATPELAGSEAELHDAATAYVLERRAASAEAVCTAAALARLGRATDDARMVRAAWAVLLGALPSTAHLPAPRTDVAALSAELSRIVTTPTG